MLHTPTGPPTLLMVGEVGADPTVPEGNGVTVRRSCRFAILR